MDDNRLQRDRRSTRLTISIPVVISGVDADGKLFRESVRTLIINKHGGKIATRQHLVMGSEVTVENPTSRVVAKANVAWLGENLQPDGMRYVGLQLQDAQNVWGIAFPPDDWTSNRQGGRAPTSGEAPAARPAAPPDPREQVYSLAGEEMTTGLLQELQRAADAQAQEFQERLKQLTHRLGLEMEFDLRERVALAEAHEVDSLKKEIDALRDEMSAAREELERLEAKAQELKSVLQPAGENPSQPSASLAEAQRQLTALANSVVERMNRAAEDGLRKFRSLLQKEQQENAARRPGEGGENPPPHDGHLPKS